MDAQVLWTRFPLLWHMAEPGSWPSIRDRGLLSTSALLDLYEIEGDRRAAIEGARRPSGVVVSKAGLPDAVIRDQKPMNDAALIRCLGDGLAPADWYRILNDRTFFWVSRHRLEKLLGARANRGRPQTVLTLDTRSLVEAHAGLVELGPINSGATPQYPTPRGLRTFLPIGEYDEEGWRKKRGAKDSVVELVVRRGVADVRDHVLAVHDWDGSAFTEHWRKPGTDPAIGP